MVNDSMPAWLATLADEIWTWLSALRVPGHPGWVRFCQSGAVLEPGDRAGLGISCLTLKTCLMLGLTSRLAPEELSGWVEHIQDFQTARGRFAGFFEDLVVLRIADRRAGWLKRDVATRRAETRQASAALLAAGAAPRWAIGQAPTTPDGVRRYIHDLDWTQPWAAGSHTGHLMFFYGLNARLFGQTAAAEALLPVVLAELDRLQDPETGSWYSRRPAAHQIVNGAMKVLTGYAFLERPFRYAERLIDTCLGLANDEDGCNNADVIYVLHQGARHTDHRRQEIRDYCWRRLEAILRFRRQDGAFSYGEKGAQTHYYGVPVSRGLLESDVHGTTLFVWTLVMIGDLLGYIHELGWRLPVT